MLGDGVSMSVTFKNAPLAEVIAELRWGTGATPLPVGSVINFQNSPPDNDPFLSSLGEELGRSKFSRSERLIPPGFPSFPFQPVTRFRQDASGETSLIIQAGAGIFSFNAIPPYHSWTRVEPIARNGIEALIRARDKVGSQDHFSTVSLRYINTFNQALMQGNSVGSFLRDIMGITVHLPPVIESHIQSGTEPLPHVQYSFNVDETSSFSFMAGEGIFQNEKVVLFDMTVSSRLPIEQEVDGIMRVLANARNIMHEIFVNITKPIHSLLAPQGVDEDAV